MKKSGGTSPCRSLLKSDSQFHNDIKLNDGATSLPISEADLAAAFEFFDIEGQGNITAADLKQRLGPFYKNLPPKDIKMLLGEGNFTKEVLRGLLRQNELGNYDPVKEAFKAYDPHGTGFAEPSMLRSIFQGLGYGEITVEDLAALVEAADQDGDGRISLDDFKSMLRVSDKRGDASASAGDGARA
uniref:EF-hand domain-containing protein n=1 Tax=Haptolina ericina TaxID=156174 RepID=A0A7S3BI66_9EUKA